MLEDGLTVAIGDRRYRLERPWGELPNGMVTDVTVDERGHVFVLLRWDPLVDRSSPRVIELDPEGRRRGAWGGELIADAHMFAAGPSARLYIVDRDAHEIVICNLDGERLAGIGARHEPGRPFNHPTDVAIAGNGDIYVADGYAGHHVHRFSSDGKLIQSWGELGDGPGQFITPHAIWVMRNGRIVVADRENNRLQVFTADGAHLATWGGFFKPMDIWGDDRDNLYVTDQIPTLTCLSADGRRIGRCRPVLNGAHGLWGDASGNLFLAEVNPSRVTRLVRLPGNASSS